jgi:tetratricopeptide (TPR) repeat protein
VPARPAPRRRFALPALLSVTLFAAGCAGPSLRPAGLPAQVELADVPFHPQRQYECGPASLAMLLNAAGVAVDPDALVPEVYLPGRRGSLQAELVAATRRHGRVAYVLQPEPSAVYAELAAGRPVVVLQNFGSRGHPQWHYAVAIGYDASHVLLRSGTDARLRLRTSRFLGTWERADRWAMVALRPGDLPARAEPRGFLAAAGEFEAVAPAEDAIAVYRAATRRWPAEPAAWFGLGNALAGGHDLSAAEDAYRHSLAIDPRYVAARNNLAELLARRGCLASARATIARAREDAAGTPLEAAVRATEAELAARRDDGPAASCPSP